VAAPLPLRSQWEREKPQFEAEAKRPGARGSYARAMLTFMPELIRFLAKERGEDGPAERRTKQPIDRVVLIGLLGVIEQMLLASIREINSDQLVMLDKILARIASDLRPQLSRRKVSGLILPGGPSF
jgi:hypothetical protein